MSTIDKTACGLDLGGDGKCALPDWHINGCRGESSHPPAAVLGLAELDEMQKRFDVGHVLTRAELVRLFATAHEAYESPDIPKLEAMVERIEASRSPAVSVTVNYGGMLPPTREQSAALGDMVGKAVIAAHEPSEPK